MDKTLIEKYTNELIDWVNPPCDEKAIAMLLVLTKMAVVTTDPKGAIKNYIDALKRVIEADDFTEYVDTLRKNFKI